MNALFKYVFWTAAVLLSAFAGCADKKPNSLASILELKLPGFEISNATFFESWPALEGVLHDQIANAEAIHSRFVIAREVRVLLGTSREGKHDLPRKERTIRDALEDFATVWDVVILVEGNTLILVDEIDEARFPHEFVIKARRQVN